MSECDVVRERMPLLLTEAVEGSQREGSHLHIEHCAECEREFSELRETWRLMGEIGELPVPSALRARFLESIGQPPVSNVVPFRNRPAARWIAQAAAVTLLVGGSFWAGRSISPETDPLVASPIAAVPYQISGSRTIPASSLAPDIEGEPRIENVRFVPGTAPGQDIQLAFDLTSEVMVTGQPGDPGLANLLAYVLKDQANPSHSRSTTIQWIRDNWSSSTSASPQLAQALTSVLQNDTHEGVRLKAIDALGSLTLDAGGATQLALIDALKNDPNPAVRLKAVEALASIAQSGTPIDPAMVDTLRLKAEQEDENLYVRLKAAEALGQIDL